MSFDTEVRKAPPREPIEERRAARRGAWLRWAVVLMVVGFVGVLIVASNLADDDGATTPDGLVLQGLQVEPRLVDVYEPFDMHHWWELPLRSFDVLEPFNTHQWWELPIRSFDVSEPYDMHRWWDLPLRRFDVHAPFDMHQPGELPPT